MIKNIQYLRFLAAFLVILAHANLQIYGVPATLTNLGGYGVDIFFIISGFIMPFILYGGMYKPGSALRMDASSFLIRRIIRIWPMYLITILTVMFVSWLTTSGIIKNPSADLFYIFNGSKIEFKWFVESVTFTHWSRPPILDIGWTLQFEFIFYTAIALLIRLRIETLKTLELWIFGLFSSFLILNLFPFSSTPVLMTLANPMLFEFAMGMVLYRVVSSGTLLHKYAAIFIAIGTIPAVLFIELNFSPRFESSFHRLLINGSTAFMLVWSALSLEHQTKEIRLLSLFGDASYSLYLVHGVVAPLLVFIWTQFELEQTQSVGTYLIAYIVVCHALGLITHLTIEKPLNNFLKNLTDREKKCAPASP